MNVRKGASVLARSTPIRVFLFLTVSVRAGRPLQKKWVLICFSQNRKWVKENLNYDVKVLNVLPIMRIMPTILLSREGKKNGP